MRTLALLTLLFLLVPQSAGSTEAGASDTQRLNRILKAEYPLARKQKIYFVFDLEAALVSIRASGTTVAELPVSRMKRWGTPRPIAAVTLTGKDSLFGPQRQVIDLSSPQEKTATGEVRALELDDMPASYSLVLSDGTRIRVSPEPANVFSRAMRLCGDALRSLTRPLISDWNFILGRPYTELSLTLSEADARRLHWSFNEGTDCLVLWPRE